MLGSYSLMNRLVRNFTVRAGGETLPVYTEQRDDASNNASRCTSETYGGFGGMRTPALQKQAHLKHC